MKISAFVVVGTVSAALAPAAMSQELSRSQVGANCAPFVASPATTGDVAISAQNWRNTDVIVAWMNFAGNAQVLGTLAPLQTFSDVSRPRHIYLFMDGNLNCIGTVTLGVIPGQFKITDAGIE